jgi:hypothetical protein
MSQFFRMEEASTMCIDVANQKPSKPAKQKSIETGFDNEGERSAFIRKRPLGTDAV